MSNPDNWLNIELKRNSVHANEPCVVCGTWDRPGELAAFNGGFLSSPSLEYTALDRGEWVCEGCVTSSEEEVRRLLSEQAAKHRRIAESYEDAATGPIKGLVATEEFMRKADLTQATPTLRVVKEGPGSEATPSSFDELPF